MKNRYLKAGAKITLVVLLSKVIGFLKQAIIADNFGVNQMTDIYFAADGLIGMLGQILLASIPPIVVTRMTYLSRDNKDDEGNIKIFVLIFGVVGIALGAIILLFSKELSNIIGLSFDSDQKGYLRFYLMCLSPIICMASIIGAILGGLEVKRIFLPSKMMGIFTSFSIIGIIVFLKDKFGVFSLVVGFLLGYTIYLFFLVVKLKHTYHGHSLKIERKELYLVLRLFLITAAGKSLVDISHVIDKIIASSLEVGSVSALYYGQIISSDLINATIISVFGMMFLPEITKVISNKSEYTEINKMISKVIKSMMYLTGMITTVYYLEAGDIVRLFFERGAFDSDASAMVSKVALAYSLGFIFMACREIVTNMFYACQDMKTPLIISFFATAVNVICSMVISRYIGVAGIAVATSISLLFAFAISVITINMKIQEVTIGKELLEYLGRILLIVTGVSVGLGFVKPFLSETPTLCKFFIVSIMAIVLYGVSSYILKVFPLELIRKK